MYLTETNLCELGILSKEIINNFLSNTNNNNQISNCVDGLINQCSRLIIYIIFIIFIITKFQL